MTDMAQAAEQNGLTFGQLDKIVKQVGRARILDQGEHTDSEDQNEGTESETDFAHLERLINNAKGGLVHA